jgi:hypothetical protein
MARRITSCDAAKVGNPAFWVKVKEAKIGRFSDHSAATDLSASGSQLSARPGDRSQGVGGNS